MTPIYLDYNATTPIDPAVLAEMLPFLREEFGNPSSAHPAGRRARDAIEQARADVAALIGASPDEIVFTSGGTESSNIAIRGAMGVNADRHAVITTGIEHPATEECCRLLEREGHPVHRIAPMPDGRVDADSARAVLNGNTALSTIIHAQNEIGTLQPVAAIARAARAAGALMHIDAAQSVGKVPVDVKALGVDLLSIAGHKLYAPKGVGALYIRRGIELPPLLAGAGQERGMRPGTENVASIAGLGAACRIAARGLASVIETMRELSETLLDRLQREVPDIVLVGDPDDRLPNTLNVLFPRASGRQILQACPRVLASTGSACHTDNEEPSAILTALGIPRGAALGAVRLSLGRGTTMADVEAAASSLAAAWRLVVGRLAKSA
jgi:cysteine desulfurase